ncbi:MAG: helix-turn-helix domain-containing protein [Brevundimonas sp.]|uniref:helix-turn-helix domain-containing protein n=1 Tax=Brevundimonas sp. TaxID=1871086 RepID=UPI0025903516|nr:helix-turn-helix domain-containing protein [Brevundimonas sp.]MCV0414936.1 helix-turn-helix domain-containing protein [Brevundimonas sp.]MEE2849168.1 helix-turn-helix domain-containing protein [Pseudomonadota bacterium]
MSTAQISLRYREGQFTPSETAAITGTPLHLQRDWRSQGLLRARQGGRASFTPRELAEMRLMMRLRGLGVSLPDARRAAVEAAPGVVFVALAQYRDQALTVEGTAAEAAAYIDSLERTGDQSYMLILAELEGMDQVYRHAVIEDGECRLLHALSEDAADEKVEAAGLINLWAVARAIAEALPRPLFTLVIPKR